MTRSILVGPGRAGMATALAMRGAGHRFLGVLARRPEAAAAAADRLGTGVLGWHEPLPEADLLVIAVTDDAIPSVAARLARVAGPVAGAVHLSGLTSVAALDPLHAAGLLTGSFHPLQTLPDADVGRAQLPGTWVAVTAGDAGFRCVLDGLARSIGARPFGLADSAKPRYHAAAAAAANFPLAALSMAEALFAAAEVPFDAAQPLVRAIVENAFAMGPSRALTGPVARGDVGTVAAQRAAVRESVPQFEPAFVAFAAELARLSGRGEEFSEVLE